jgi:hypothetical protein
MALAPHDHLHIKQYRASAGRLPWVPDTLARGNTLRRHACVHWTGRDVTSWLAAQRSAGLWVVGMELADEAVRLADLPAARRRTVAVLGHEQSGTPPEAIELLDVAARRPADMDGSAVKLGQASNRTDPGGLHAYGHDGGRPAWAGRPHPAGCRGRSRPRPTAGLGFLLHHRMAHPQPGWR